ncbi:MAG: 4-hydroxythreonine-4-phosphate dehydrogenase PdxA [Chitinophagales bacterium]|jgi:4-hydroxythreonine-4-phosphate dehydrogenase|nr:4-hydroxythreonine-4-phosphate dehydrogenase PdxA [Chitinophagales bacterium]
MSSELKKKPNIGITLGDFNGIGPLAVLKALQYERLMTLYNIYVFGHPDIIQYYRNLVPNFKAQFQTITELDSLKAKNLNLVVCHSEEKLDITPGKPNAASGSMSLAMLDKAIEFHQKGLIDALMTAPIDKSVIPLANFIGHTEYLAQKYASKSMMLMISDEMKVAFATSHIALNEVSSHITSDKLYTQIKTLGQILQENFQIYIPKIAVLGLNPHNSDHGKFGNEEQKIIIPTIEKLKEERFICSGPFSADGFFSSRKYLDFDAVLCMYHDQGMTPFKYITGSEGVNFTAGIPLVRTSPDHGTAIDSISYDLCDERPTLHALLAIKPILKNRKLYQDIQANKLNKIELKSEDNYF